MRKRIKRTGEWFLTAIGLVGVALLAIISVIVGAIASIFLGIMIGLLARFRPQSLKELKEKLKQRADRLKKGP